MELLLHYNNGQTAKVKASLTQDNHLLITNSDKIRFELSGAVAEVLQYWAEELNPDNGIMQGNLQDQAETFNFITIDDLEGLDSHQAKRLLAVRFPWLYDKDPVIPAQPQPNGSQATPHQAVDQLSLDMVTIQDISDELIEDGKPVWGAQTRVAEALGIENAGSSNRKRIKAVLRRLLNIKSAA